MGSGMKLALLCIFLLCHGVATADRGNALLDGNQSNDTDSSSNHNNSSSRGSDAVVNGGNSSSSGSNIFNVMDFGAKADGLTDDSLALLAAWKAACDASGRVTVVIPSGNYFLNPLQFSGPCRNVQALAFQLQGTLKASTDLSKYGDGEGWVEFGWVDNLTLAGGGTFDGQGEVSWPHNKCPQEKNCKVLPTSVKFLSTNNTIVKDITSTNSKFFHMALLHCYNFKGSSITITAPEDSPNTDGIHLERNTGVIIARSTIGTGDDCISIGQGNSGVTITGITCGPGHGISIGSLGRYSHEKDVENIVVRNSTFINTVNGVRIKTWANSPVSTSASNLTFDNLVMMNVGQPVLIDQQYCPYAHCDNTSSSRVQISDVHFSNIRGTATMSEAVTIKCSKGLPCYKVTLENINLQKFGGAKNVTSTCLNAHPQFTGTNNPPPCQ